jgi:Lon protease-like protein
MSSFEDYSLSVDEHSGTARLFPLPNLVLFPHVMQPLHVFEPRYRDLVEAALADDRLIAMALLTPGWERDYEGRPPLYSTACLGRVAAHVRLRDGSHNVLLMGLRRVGLIEELPPEHRYRVARVEIRDDVQRACDAERASDLLGRLRRAFLRILPAMAQAEDQLEHLLRNQASLGTLTDVVAYMLDVGLDDKQALLAEVDVCRRAELLLSHLSAAARDGAPGRCGAAAFPPGFGAN